MNQTVLLSMGKALMDMDRHSRDKFPLFKIVIFQANGFKVSTLKDGLASLDEDAIF